MEGFPEGSRMRSRERQVRGWPRISSRGFSPPEDELFRDGSESVLAPRPLRADPDDVAEVLVRDA